jgi:type IV pilus assembly protein PilY1
MHTPQSTRRQRQGYVARTALAAMALLVTAPAAFGQLTDIASNPLTTSAPNQVKPNLLFILDDSGSMSRGYMPDDVSALTSGSYGFYASQCNGLAYNPNSTYSVPVDSAGADLAAGTYTFPSPDDLNNIRSVTSTAPTIGTGTFTLNLSGGSSGSYPIGSTVTLYSNDNPTGRYMVGTVTAWNSSTDVISVNVTDTNGSGTLTNPRIGDGDARPFYYTYSGAQPALAYTYNSSGVITSTTFYQQCNSVVGSSPGSTVFSKVIVTPANITQNYRNWYTYYRTRMLMAKSATSLAFRTLGDRFRVGYTTISSRYVNGSEFLDVADFDATQKSDFYTYLNNASPGSTTPLRGALGKAGKYYAKRGRLENGNAQTVDPVQFSCQKNFAILTTDGYWNTGTEVSGSGSDSYGPDRLDNTDVGQQDGTAPRPMNDGATALTQTRTSNLQQRTTSSQLQTATVQLQQRSGALQTRNTTNGGSSWSSWSNTSSCAWDTSGSNQRQCRYNYGSWSNASSCTVSGNTGTSGTWTTTPGVQCQYTSPSWSNAGSCTPSSPPPSGSSPYTVASATLCQTVTNTSAWSNVSSCTAGSGVECQYTNWTSWSNISSCTAEPRSTASPYTVGTARECQSSSSGGSTNSLADVAMYYYETDLRTTALGNCTLASGTDVCTNNVPPRGTDTATHQHMSTFTVGMGVNGTLGYANNYLAGGSADYQAIVQGTRDWPIPVSSTNGGSAENIDDLWHAAVNGRGQYFNAGDPASLALGLTTALAAIDAQTGSGSGAAASTLQPVAGDNYLFIAKYTTVHWTGELVARTIDPQTGVISTTDAWSAEQLLDARVAAGTARSIYYMQRSGSANTGTLRAFTYANLNTDGLGGNFSNACSKAVPLTQCSDSGYDTAGANSGANMVDFLRGTYFGIYRNRQHILGDIVGGAPVYVRRPPFQYTENNYTTFASTNASRTGVVYVASNDGMLHAFNGATGEEMWAYVPTMVMDRMYRLADNDYANRHEFFVNGAPVVGDIWVPGSPGQWKTILVGGLGAGGRGYYALDITNPSAPQALWEFTNDSLGGADNLGLTFGNPVITKRADGTWVVAFTSGYNNVSPGDGNGRLFVVNANTGQRVAAIQTFTTGTTAAGSTTMPSGLGKLNAWVESTIDNTARRYYAGDLLGNLWRFDIDNLVAPNNAALRLAYLQAGSPTAVAQPITTQPALGLVDYAGSQVPVVYVGTGRMLGLSDLSSTALQTIYAIKDPLTNTPLGDVHASSSVIAQTLSQASANAPRTITSNAVNWTTDNGWRVDLIGTGERVNVDMQVIFQSLNVASNTPNNDACTAGGSSYLYHFDLNTGSAPQGSTDGVVGTWLGGTLVVGMSYLTLQQTGSTDPGTGRTITVIIDNRGVPRTDDVPPPPPPPATGRRTSWRELVN